MSESQRLLSLLETLKPTHVIHLAAMASPAAAHFDQDLAWKTNVDAVKTLALYAANFGARLVFTSSDFVFRGDLDRPYGETDEANPTTFYGHTKVCAEEHVLANGGLVARLSLLYPLFDDLASNLTRFAKAGNALAELRAVEDEYRSPLRPVDAAAAIVELAFMDVLGTFHLAGPEALSTYTLVSREAVAHNLDIPIRRISRLSVPPPCRPKNVCLDASKLLRLCPHLRFAQVLRSYPELTSCVTELVGTIVRN